MHSPQITTTYVVRIDQGVYPQLGVAAAQGTLRRVDEPLHVMPGGTVYRPAPPARQVLVHDRLFRLGGLDLPGDLTHLPEQEYASLVGASLGEYRQYPGAHGLMTGLMAPMSPAGEAAWLAGVRAAVVAGRQAAAGVDLVDDVWRPVPWRRVGTRLIRHGGHWFLHLEFGPAERQRTPPGRKVIGVDVGRLPLITAAAGPDVITGWEVHAPEVPAGEPAEVRAFAETLVYTAARASLEFVTQHLLRSARVLVLEDLDYTDFRSRFAATARATAVADWHQAWLPQRAYARGVTVARVSAAYTSQTCSRCLSHVRGTREGRVFTCPRGHVLDAHANAARNLVRRYWGGLRPRQDDRRGSGRRRPTAVRPMPRPRKR